MKTKQSSRVARSLSRISILLVLLALGISNVDHSEGKLILDAFAPSDKSIVRPDVEVKSGTPALIGSTSEHSAIERIETPNPSSLPCPSPFTPQGGSCVLHRDQTISTTVEPASNTTLDCQNNKLSAAASGSGIDPWPGSRSNPEVAIFLNGVQNVTIRNCIIENFDFGVIAHNSKHPGLPVQSANKQMGVKAKTTQATTFIPIKILGNTITARFAAISLMAAVDQAEIKDNTLQYLTMGGRALYVARNSDANIIQRNKIFADFSSGQRGALMVPGPSFMTTPASLSTNPKLNTAPAILVTQILGGEPTLLNAIIGGLTGKLYQITLPGAVLTEDPVPPRRPPDTSELSQQNVIDDNTITYPSPSGTPPIMGNDGIVTSVTAGSVISKNKIWFAAAAIRAGIQIGMGGVKQFPGTCSSDATRLCLQDSDCLIPGFDSQSKGNCALPATRKVFWLASGNTVENNEIYGPFLAGIILAGNDTMVQGNTIDGNVPQGPWKGTAISVLGKYALGTTTVTANKILKVDTGISLQRVFEERADVFGAKVYGNSISDYNTPVRTAYEQPLPSPSPSPYALASELSVNEQGNYWGSGPCPPGFDPNRVVDVAMSLNCPSMTGICWVTDKHALCTAPVRVQPPASRERATAASSKKLQQNKVVPRKKKPRKG